MCGTNPCTSRRTGPGPGNESTERTSDVEWSASWTGALGTGKDASWARGSRGRVGTDTYPGRASPQILPSPWTQGTTTLGHLPGESLPVSGPLSQDGTTHHRLGTQSTRLFIYRLNLHTQRYLISLSRQRPKT